MNLHEIRQILPHRAPFLFLDDIDVDAEGRSAVGHWTPRTTWPVFKGHFPGHPVVPGVILIEVMAQAALILGRAIETREPDEFGMLVGVDHARFRRPIHPGDTVEVRVRFRRRRRHLWAFAGEIRRDSAMAAQAELLATLSQTV